MAQLEAKVEQKEALAAGRAEVAAARMANGFESLESDITTSEADQQLEELRHKLLER